MRILTWLLRILVVINIVLFSVISINFYENSIKHEQISLLQQELEELRPSIFVGIEFLDLDNINTA